MAKSLIFLYFCLSFIGGIFIDSFIAIGQLLWLVFLIFVISLITVFWRYKKLAVLSFCLLFLVLGIWRHHQVLANIPQIQEQSINFVGTVSAEPDVRENHTKLTLGEILVTTSKYPEYQHGDKLKVSGKLVIPQEFEDFNYKDYLIKNGIYSVMYYPQIELLGENEGGLVSIIYGWILTVKDKLRVSIYQNLSPPQSSILGAMVLGDKSRLSDDLKEKLNITGLRHITAISGMHITILSVVLMQFLLGLGLWRRQAFYITLAFLILFIIMVGLPASAVRAGIMGGAFLLAKNLGRPSSASRLVVFAAAAMLAVNPLLLKLDVGFQLSFLAVLGIIYLSPILEKFFRKVPDIIQLRSILAMTLSAQVFTLPILIYNFGYVSLIAPLVNILIIPLLPFIMILGFLAGIAGMIFQPLGWIMSWPAWALLTYLTKVVDWFSQIPLAFITLEISWVWLIAAYLILGCFTWRLNQTNRF